MSNKQTIKFSKEELAQAKDKLREWFPKGSTVHTVLRSVSSSGMTRVIGVLCIKGETILHPNYNVAGVLGRRWCNGGLGDGVEARGAGMDMGFDLVYSLASVLYGDGYALRHQWV